MRGEENNHHEQIGGEEQLTCRQRHQDLLDGGFAAESLHHLWYVNHAVNELVHGVAFHHPEEKPAAGGATEEQSPDHLFDFAPAGDAGDEHRHAWGIGDPPQPVEDGPVAGKGAVAERVGKQAHLQEVLGRQADGVNDVIGDEFGRANQ